MFELRFIALVYSRVRQLSGSFNLIPNQPKRKRSIRPTSWMFFFTTAIVLLYANTVVTSCNFYVTTASKRPTVETELHQSITAGNISIARQQRTIKLANLQYNNSHSYPKTLHEPHECTEWRTVAWQPSKLRLYQHRGHFNSHDLSDWFLYTAIFNETWHSRLIRRPVYLDIAANHARKWSTTWFFDRCLGWGRFLC